MTIFSTISQRSYSLVDLLKLDILHVHELFHGPRAKSSSLFSFLPYLLSPFILPVFLYRISHYFKLRRHFRKLLTCLNLLFGIEIASSCSIGLAFSPHSSGTVIGAWSIGANSTIFGVTLGAKISPLILTSLLAMYSAIM